jgi:DNA-binding NarL/FixJ family response regulator
MSPQSESSAARSGPPLNVMIIEDQRDVREGLAVLVHGTPGFRCTRSYRTMEEALRALSDTSREPPDVILTDIGLPGMSGIDGIAALRKQFDELPILALTIYDSDDKVFNALCAGASGYLLKNTPPARLLESLQEVAAGRADVARSCSTRRSSLPRVPSRQGGDLSLHAPGKRAAEAPD